jgi:hypothetical protein
LGALDRFTRRLRLRDNAVIVKQSRVQLIAAPSSNTNKSGVRASMTALAKMSRNVALTLKVLIRIVPLYIPTTGITSRI